MKKCEFKNKSVEGVEVGVSEHVFIIRALNPTTKTPEFFTGEFNLTRFNKSQYPNKARRYKDVLEAVRVARALYELFPQRSFVVERVVLKGDVVDRRGSAKAEVSIVGDDSNVVSREVLNVASVTGNSCVDSSVVCDASEPLVASETTADFSEYTGYKLFVRDKADLCYEKAMRLGYVFTDRCNKRTDSFLYLSDVNMSATSGNNRTTFVNSVFKEITPDQLLEMSTPKKLSIVEKYKDYTFQTFESVLFKQDEFSVWCAGLFSHKTTLGKYVIIGATSPTVDLCVPYNEGTLELLGTLDEEIPTPLPLF